MTRGLWRERQGYHKEGPEEETGNGQRDEGGWLGEVARPRPPGALYAPRSASKLILHPAHYTRPEIHQLPRISPAPQNPNGFIIIIIIIIIIINFFFSFPGACDLDVLASSVRPLSVLNLRHVALVPRNLYIVWF